MPVKTRSQKKQHQHDILYNTYVNDDLHITADITSSCNKRQRRVKIMTPSFIEASTKTYKVYSRAAASTLKHKKSQILEDEEAANAAHELLELHNHDQEESDADADADAPAPDALDADAYLSEEPSVSHQTGVHTCINPMNPISKYIYRLGIYNIAQTVHYKTAYVLYDSSTRLYHVHTIISNHFPHQDSVVESVNSRTEFTLPSPRNTIQTKYKSYIDETVTNFIMTMVVPSNEHDYYIQDDILGLAIQQQEFQKNVFEEDSCFYDIEDLMYDNTSNETTTGFKAFMLVPSRNFWYSPAGAYYNTPADANTLAYRDNRYMSHTLDSVLSILSQSY